MNTTQASGTLRSFHVVIPQLSKARLKHEENSILKKWVIFIVGRLALFSSDVGEYIA